MFLQYGVKKRKNIATETRTSASWRGRRAAGSFRRAGWRRGSARLPSAWTERTDGSWRHPAAGDSGKGRRETGVFYFPFLRIDLVSLYIFFLFFLRTKHTMKESVRSGMPVSFTQASITPWISAVMVEPVERRSLTEALEGFFVCVGFFFNSPRLYLTYRWWRRSPPPHRNRPRCWCTWPRCVATAPRTAGRWGAAHRRWCCLEKRE